jgi:hypothetical protein
MSTSSTAALVGALSRSAAGVVLCMADHEVIAGSVSVVGISFVVVRQRDGVERRVNLAAVAAANDPSGRRLWPLHVVGGRP